MSDVALSGFVSMNKWLIDHLVCPRDRKALRRLDLALECPDGHRYPIFDGVPIMLLDDADSTHGYIEQTLAQVGGDQPLRPVGGNTNGVDGFVQGEVPHTSGSLYFSVQHKLRRYPIPHTRLRAGNGARLLDIGCNWGRWSIAAARRGFQPVGVDPSLDAVLAARRVAKQLGVDADFLVGDARYLPFSDEVFDTVFSYSVFQHFSKENAARALGEAARVMAEGSKSLVQMPNKYGVRQYQQHRRRGWTEGEGFEVRYWSPSELIETFERLVGPTTLTADCYFGLGIQESDADLLPLHYRAIVRTSQLLRKASQFVKPLAKLADSVYLESIKRPPDASL